MPNPLISQVKLPDNTVYDLKDAAARSDIANIYELIEGGVNFIGVIADAPAHQISDGDTTNPVTIKNGASTKSVTATAGDIVFQGTNEFIWDGTAWRAFGEATGLKAFAFADTGSASYTPAGSVAQPTFTGTKVQLSGTTTAAGTVDQPTFTGAKVKISGTVTPSGSISGSFSGTGVRLVTGNIAVPKTFSTATATTENKTATVSAAGSGDTTYTPAGSVSGTNVTLNTTTVNSITAVGTLPTMPTCTLPTATVSGEVLTFTAGSYTAGSPGTLPTKGSAQTVATSIDTITDPSFSGTGVRLVTGNIAVPKTYTTTVASTENKTATVSPAESGTATYTPAGNVSATFTGDSNTVSISVAADANGNYTPTGTVSQPSFTGSSASVTITATENANGNYQPKGTVTKPSFTGTAATITVNPVTTP